MVFYALHHESVRLLLNSKNAEFPDGLANSSGTLGKYVMDHNFGSGASGSYPGFADKRTIGNRPNGTYIARFRNVKSQHPDFVRGYAFQAYSGRSGWERGHGAGSCAKSSNLDRELRWYVLGLVFGESLPSRRESVTLDPL